MNKTFDCVEMKRESQRKLREEFAARQTEFLNYADFLRAKADESEWARRSKKALSQSPVH